MRPRKHKGSMNRHGRKWLKITLKNALKRMIRQFEGMTVDLQTADYITLSVKLALETTCEELGIDPKIALAPL